MKRLLISVLLVFVVYVSDAQSVRDTVVVNDEWRYEGEWPEGKGVLIHDTKGIFWGEFQEGVPRVCKHCDFHGNSYEGNIVDYLPDGYGRKFFKSGDVYDGQFQKGAMTGVAKYFDVGEEFKIKQGRFENGSFVEGRELVLTQEKFASMKPVFSMEGITEEQVDYLKKGIENTHPPTFGKGDMNNFAKWVNSQLRYPSYSKKNGIQGRVMLSFVIGEDGKIKDVEVLRGSPSKELDIEAVRVVSSAPKFRPAVINGHKTSVRYTFPVIFLLR